MSAQGVVDELNAIKRELKGWETMFHRHNGRKPTNEDVQSTSEEIRKSYVQYRHLKKELQVQENKYKGDMAGDGEEKKNGVFGRAFNKPKLVEKKSLMEESNMKKADETAQMNRRILHWTRNGGHSSTNQMAKKMPSKEKEDEPKMKDDNLLVGSEKEDDPPVVCAGSALRSGSALSGNSKMTRKRRFNLDPSWLEECQPQAVNTQELTTADSEERISLTDECHDDECHDGGGGGELCDQGGDGKASDNGYGEECAEPIHSCNDESEIMHDAGIDILPIDLVDFYGNQDGHSSSERQPVETSTVPLAQASSLWTTLSPGRKSVSTSLESVKKACKEKITSSVCEKLPDRKPQLSKAKKRPSRGLVSENFVRIDMKRRFYRRKGGVGSAAKRFSRQSWKRKFCAKFGKSERNGCCFKCGEEGHWAASCPGKPEERGNGGDIGEEEEEEGVPDGRALMELPSLPIRPSEMNTALPPPAGEPLYDSELIADGTTPQEVYQALEQLGYSSFRPGQEQAVVRTLCGLSTLVVLSTGSGKSLCYQLPAYLYAKHQKGITLVISPLVSLIEDQVRCLPFGLQGAFIHSGLQSKRREKILSEVSEGNVSVLLMSPEFLINGKDSIQFPPIAFACIDEVHCISEWSHNFRPSYLQLCHVLRQKHGVSCFLGLTATATSSTVTSVAKHLGLLEDSDAIIWGPPLPENLRLSVSCDVRRDKALVELLQGKRFLHLKSIIIYCTRQQETERLAQFIRTSFQDERGAWSAEAYHAGLTSSQRCRVQKRFTVGKVRVVVATVAFGMGINMADVGGIVHYNMPKTLESYVQEIGRAGRDGKEAQCHVFLESGGSDMHELRRHCVACDVEPFTIKRFVSKVFPHCRCQELAECKDSVVEGECEHVCGAAGHEMAMDIEQNVNELDLKEETLATLLCYLELGEWIRQLPPCYSQCAVKCYGGAQQMRALTNKCLAINAALALTKERCIDVESASTVQFNVIELCDRMGWESGLVRRELKSLQWDVGGGKVPRKTGVFVEFSNLAFRFRCPGNLSACQRDVCGEFLVKKVNSQVTVGLSKLQSTHDFLLAVAHDNVTECLDGVEIDQSCKLRESITAYFDRDNQDVMDGAIVASAPPLAKDDEIFIRRDVISFLSLHSDQKFRASAVARIFQGIASPKYPAEVWGTNKRYWRRHMAMDFFAIRKIVAEEIVKLR